MEEQRQVVGQWKRKAQKMTNEMNDLRMLLEEQNSRNNLLEKRQRKFDSECQALQVLYFEFLTGLLKNVEKSALLRCIVKAHFVVMTQRKIALPEAFPHFRRPYNVRNALSL